MARTTDRAPTAHKSQPPLTPCDRMRAEIGKYADWDANTVQAIAQAENRSCDPKRHNLTASETHRRADGSVICVGSYGALQVGCLHYQANEDRDDLATNIRAAHRVYQSRKAWDSNGYNAWTTYLNGMYRGYLK